MSLKSLVLIFARLPALWIGFSPPAATLTRSGACILCARRAEFSGGIPVGSVCSGWEVAEMVIAELNEKMAGYYPELPEACDP